MELSVHIICVLGILYIVKLKAPAVLSHIPRNDSLSVKVQLYEDDMLTISFGQLGMIEAAVMSQGINYLIDVESQHTETVSKMATVV